MYLLINNYTCVFLVSIFFFLFFLIALAVAITCASVALSDAGVEMLDLPVACSVVSDLASALQLKLQRGKGLADELKRKRVLFSPKRKTACVLSSCPVVTVE